MLPLLTFLVFKPIFSANCTSYLDTFSNGNDNFTTLYIPKHKYQYPNNLRCTYDFNLDQDEYLNVLITFIELEAYHETRARQSYYYDQYCDFDYLKISTNATANSKVDIARFCHGDIWNFKNMPYLLHPEMNITSSTGTVVLYFHSDSNVAKNGIKQGYYRRLTSYEKTISKFFLYLTLYSSYIEKLIPVQRHFYP